MVPNVRKAATPSLRDADAAAEAEALAWSVLATKEQTMAVRAAMTPDAMAQQRLRDQRERRGRAALAGIVEDRR